MKKVLLFVSIITTIVFSAKAGEEKPCQATTITGGHSCEMPVYTQTNTLTEIVKEPNQEELAKNNLGLNPNSRFLLVTASALTGIDDGINRINKSYNIVSGIRFGSGTRLGLGTGIENFDESVIPFFAYFSFPFGKGITSPFVYVKGGYGVAFLSEQPSNWSDPGSHGGILWGAGASINLFSWNRVALNAGAGYRFQKLIGKKHGPWQVQKIVDFSRIDMNLSISF